jgi:hypothetical protein
VAIAPISGVQGALYTIPVTPIRPAAVVVRAQAADAVAQALAETAGGAAAPEALEALAQVKAVDVAAQTAVTRQGGMAPLFADLARTLQSPNLPPEVHGAITQLMAQATPLTARPDAAAVARGLSQSGLFLESQLAQQPEISPAGRDMKADLLILREVLQGWLGAPARALTPRAAASIPPPYRGGPTTAQAPATPTLERGAPAPVAGLRLAQETEAALARHELMQLASLPGARPDPGEAQVTRWMYEAPFLTPQGATIAQFEISRDDAQSAREGGAGPIYRARFSIDIEPLGPVHAHVSLAGDHAGVTLWAEREASVAVLQGARSWLSQALTKAELRSDIAVYPGAPPRPAPGAGQFVDRST